MTLEQILQQQGVAYQRRGRGEFFVAWRSPKLLLLAIRVGARDYALSLPPGELPGALARWRLRPDGWQPLLPQQPLTQQRGGAER